MEQFSILEVIVTIPEGTPYHKYLNFIAYPEIKVVDALSASTLFPRVSDAHNHAKVFIEQLQEGGPLSRGFLKDLDMVAVSVRIVHYSGPTAGQLTPNVTIYPSLATISKQEG